MGTYKYQIITHHSRLTPDPFEIDPFSKSPFYIAITFEPMMQSNACMMYSWRELSKFQLPPSSNTHTHEKESSQHLFLLDTNADQMAAAFRNFEPPLVLTQNLISKRRFSDKKGLLLQPFETV